MIKIHFDSGETISLISEDGESPEEIRRTLAVMKHPEAQRAITGVTLVERYEPGARRVSSPHFGVQYSVPRPLNFRDVQFEAEAIEADDKQKGGQRLVVFADDVRLTVMAHKAQPAVRISLAKMGRRRQRNG